MQLACPLESDSEGKFLSDSHEDPKLWVEKLRKASNGKRKLDSHAAGERGRSYPNSTVNRATDHNRCTSTI